MGEPQTKKIDNTLKVQIYQIGEKFNFNSISTKCRARIFYKGLNRNGTYITDEFAEKLISTIAYTPVKGIWDEEQEDFTDHGSSRTEGKIYGVALAEPNFAWETQTDEDGVERTYACVDVLIYTAIYPEASKIVGKSLSMELLPKSISGNWEVQNGIEFFRFTDACFAGLQALGDNTEPCFEGAAFYALGMDWVKLFKAIDKFNLDAGGKQKMTINFDLSNRETFDLIWDHINPQFNEQNDYQVTATICDVYDNYAICFSYKDNNYFKLNFKKSDDKIDFTSREAGRMLFVNDEEYDSLTKLRSNNSNNFEKIDEKFSKMQEDNTNYSTIIEENKATIESLNTSNTELQTKYDQLNTEYTNTQTTLEEVNNSLTEAQNELTTLKEFKKSAEDNAKNQIVEKYAAMLSDEVVGSIKENLDNYDAESLERELSYQLVKSQPSVFSLEEDKKLPKVVPPAVSGINAILDKYKTQEG